MNLKEIMTRKKHTVADSKRKSARRVSDTFDDAIEFTARTIRKKDKEMTDEEMDEAVDEVEKMEELSDSAKSEAVWNSAYDDAVAKGLDFEKDFNTWSYSDLVELGDIRKKYNYKYQSPTGSGTNYPFFKKLHGIHQKRRQDSAKKVNDSENIYADFHDEYAQDNDAWNIYLMLENNDGDFWNGLWNALLKKAKRGLELDIDTLANSQVVKNQARKMRKDLNDIRSEDGDPTVSLDSDKKGRYLFAEAMLRSVKDELEYHTNEK